LPIRLSALYPLPLSRQTAAFANNHWQGQAVDTARQLKMLLGREAAIKQK